MLSKYPQISQNIFKSNLPRFYSNSRPFIVKWMNHINAKGESELIATITSRNNDTNLITKLETELKKDFLEVYRRQDELVVVQNKASFINKIGMICQQILPTAESQQSDQERPGHSL